MVANDIAAIEEASRSVPSQINNDYYNGVARIHQLGLSLPPEMRALQTVINWPRLVVDSLEERLDVEGFRMTGQENNSDDRLWAWWQANRLDEESSLGHIEALVQGQAAVFVGANEEDPTTPLITVESLAGIRIIIDRRTGKVQYAVRIYEWDEADRPTRAAVYLPEVTRYYHTSSPAFWKLDYQVRHSLPVVPVVPLINRARLSDRAGRSEMADIIPLTDAACRSMSNLQGAQELLAVPSRYVFGASEGDFVGPDGVAKTTWEAYMGRINAIENTEAKVQQVPGADLRNFTEVIRFYAQTVSSLSGLPPEYLGVSSDNPSSADAIRMLETRLIKRAERKARAFGESWEQVMRIGLLITDGKLPDDAFRMETVWRDPATPTYAAKADAVVKLVSAKDAQGRSILPIDAAREELGMSFEKRRRLLALEDDDPAVRFLAVDGTLNDDA
jgi:hypothetical protein